MKLFGPLSRALALGAMLVVALSLPALAGPAEMSLLQKYMGTWKGSGVMSGGQAQSVTCKMALSQGNGEKLNYTGRCSVAGQQLSVTGTIAWIDAKHRYEAVMNSGIGGFKGVAIGQKSGANIVFDLQQRANDDQGNDITISAKVILTAANISVDFHATFNTSGDKVDISIPFARA